MQTQEPVSIQRHPDDRNANRNSGMQVLCLEVERQLNRHYKRVLAFFTEAFSDNTDYPLSAEQALMLFCISNGLRDTAQLWRTVEPVTPQSVFILASLYAQGYVVSAGNMQHSEGLELATLELTARGQGVADGLYELYTYVFLVRAGREVPDTARLASMHVSLRRLQNHNHLHKRG